MKDDLGKIGGTGGEFENGESSQGESHDGTVAEGSGRDSCRRVEGGRAGQCRGA
jgi:hypothetical protein